MSVSLFDAEAERYDAAYDGRARGARVLRARLAAAVEIVGDGPGDALDVGMGPGRLLAELERRGWTIAGVDPSSVMVSLARRRLPAAADRLVQAPAEELPFEAASFDCVAVTGTLEYVDDLPQALGELARVLRPRGRAALSFPNYRAPTAILRRLAWDPLARRIKSLIPFGKPAPALVRRALGRAELTRVLEQAGFRIERVQYVGSSLRILAPQIVLEVRRAG